MVSLEPLARGELSLDIAHENINQALASGVNLDTIYSVMMRYTWLMLTERRCDTDLRGWHRVLLSVTSQVERYSTENSSDLSSRIRCLSDMVQASAGMSIGPTREDILNRSPEAEVLEYMRAKKSFIARSSLEKHFDMKPASMSRILTLFVFHGLAYRDPISVDPRYKAL